VRAHVLNLELELRLRALLGALEGEMLEEVGGAIGLVCFGARAGIDPDADGRRLGIGGVVARYLRRCQPLTIDSTPLPFSCLP